MLYTALLLSNVFCFVIAIVFESFPQGLKLLLPSFTNCLCCHLGRRNQSNDEEWRLHQPAVIIRFRNTQNPCGIFWIKAFLESFFTLVIFPLFIQLKRTPSWRQMADRPQELWGWILSDCFTFACVVTVFQLLVFPEMRTLQQWASATLWCSYTDELEHYSSCLPCSGILMESRLFPPTILHLVVWPTAPFLLCF